LHRNNYLSWAALEKFASLNSSGQNINVARHFIMSFESHFSSLALRDSSNQSQYAYVMTRYVCVIFVSLFGLSTVIHIGQAVFYRLWWLLPTVGLAGCLEVLGWSGRLWSSYNAFLNTPFMIAICTTIIGPTPLLAANFVMVERIIVRLGPHFSRLSPKRYLIIFCSCDVVSLVVQGTGGGLASTANTPHGARTGANIMLGGIVFQLATLIVFVIFATEFFVRYLHDTPVDKSAKITKREPLTRKLRLMLIALAFNSTCLFIRAIYRTIELSGGWNGRVISTQVYFTVLDGAMVLLAIFTINFAHPGVLLRVPKLDKLQG
jgi:hypothetical protein